MSKFDFLGGIDKSFDIDWFFFIVYYTLATCEDMSLDPIKSLLLNLLLLFDHLLVLFCAHFHLLCSYYLCLCVVLNLFVLFSHGFEHASLLELVNFHLLVGAVGSHEEDDARDGHQVVIPEGQCLDSISCLYRSYCQIFDSMSVIVTYAHWD